MAAAGALCLGCERPPLPASRWCSECQWKISARDRKAFEDHIAVCLSCQALIIWFKTPAGNNMPVDLETVRPGDDVLDLTRHRSHFATCPDANKHRRARR